MVHIGIRSVRSLRGQWGSAAGPSLKDRKRVHLSAAGPIATLVEAPPHSPFAGNNAITVSGAKQIRSLQA